MSLPKKNRLEPVRSAEDLEIIRSLFTAYVDSLDIDISFQGFATELYALPGKYAPPGGEILLARDAQGSPIGCVGLRPILPLGCCEMKRLYIMPSGRGLGIGKALIDAILDVATNLGYHDIKLDTLPSMVQAQSLYRSAGFVETAPYYDTPLAGTVFLTRSLRGRKSSLGVLEQTKQAISSGSLPSK